MYAKNPLLCAIKKKKKSTGAERVDSLTKRKCPTFAYPDTKVKRSSWER
jgi:hypothetical protein